MSDQRSDPDEARAICLARLRKFSVDDRDPEVNHSEKDDAILVFLRALGYDDLVDEWEKGTKWYA